MYEAVRLITNIIYKGKVVHTCGDWRIKIQGNP